MIHAADNAICCCLQRENIIRARRTTGSVAGLAPNALNWLDKRCGEQQRERRCTPTDGHARFRVVCRRAGQAFHWRRSGTKYGGITVSDLDAMDLMRKMDAAYCAFFKDPDIEVHWKAWSASRAAGKDTGAAMALSDFLDSLVKEDIGRATLLRKAGTAWLNSRMRLRGILDFNRAELAKHNDEARASFAEQVAIHLSSKTREIDERVAAVFDIDLVEEAEGWGVDELPEAEERKKRKKGQGDGTPQSAKAVAEALELLTALQLTEQQKLELIEKLKAFLLLLFKSMDRAGRARNNDIHRKMVLAMAEQGEDYPWEERFGKFRDLLDAANVEAAVFTHPNRKQFLPPLMKRAELVMADYEEWIVTGGASIAEVGSLPELDYGGDGLSEKAAMALRARYAPDDSSNTKWF